MVSVVVVMLSAVASLEWRSGREFVNTSSVDGVASIASVVVVVVVVAVVAVVAVVVGFKFDCIALLDGSMG